MRTMISVAAAAFLGLSGLAFAADAPAKTGQTSAGPSLVNASGMTLYVFDKDVAGKSNCNGPCATNWPPFAAEGSATDSGAFTIVTRDDGARQWAYKGKPLYTWKDDKKPGDSTGSTRPAWHIAAP